MLVFAGGSFVSDKDVVVFQYLRFWAERGLIHVEDARDNSYEVVSVHDSLERMDAVSELVKIVMKKQRSEYSEDQLDENWRKNNQDMLDGMIELVHKAQNQGMPFDQSAVRDLVRRAPKTVVVPAYGGGM